MIPILATLSYFIDVASNKECIDVAIANNGVLITSIPCTAWFHCKQLWPKAQL